MKRILFLVLAFCWSLILSDLLSAQYSSDVFSLKKSQDLYDEHGFEHGSSINVDGKLNISNANGAVSYSYPISSHNEGGYQIDVALNYCGSVAWTTFKDYNLADREGGDSYTGWAKFHQNRPAWILGVNGFAVNVIATTSHFHADSASRAFMGTVFDYTDKDFIWTIDGYDWCNRMRDFNPVGANDDHGYVDVIRLLRADGSLLDLYNVHKDSTANPDTRPELYTGYYHTNAANDPAFGIVEYDSTYWPEYIASFTRSQAGTASQRAPLVCRKLHYYSGDGLEYIFREWLLPYGMNAYKDIESRGGGVWGHPTIFYLEEIRSNGGTITTFYRTRHYPIIGNPLFQYWNDETRGRALITQWDGHQLSFGYNSMMIEALGRTTQVKFDTIMRSGNMEPWEYFPWANNGGMTPAATQLAGYQEGNRQLYKSSAGYVTKLIDAEGRVTSFDYETVTRVYDDLNFPHANPLNGGGHQRLTFKNYRLKSVTEPTAKYVIAYNPGSGQHITSGTTDQPTLNDMVDTVRKFDKWGGLLTTDVYNFTPISPTRKSTSVTTKDNVTGLAKTTTYFFDYYNLGYMSGILPPGRHTVISQVNETADDGRGGALSNATFTAYEVGTNIPGVGTNSSYLILPTETHTTVQGVTKSYQKFRYTVDTVNHFGGNQDLAGRFGVQTTRRIAQTCRPEQPSKILLTDTTNYVHFGLLDTVMTWQEWHWKKLPTIARYLALRDSHDVRLIGKRWEDVLFAPFVAVIEPDTMTELVHMPPVYGLEHESWTSDSTGCISGEKKTYLNDLGPVTGRKVRDLLVADTILGRNKKPLLGHSYSYTEGWTGNSIAAKTDALGVPEFYTYNYYWSTADSVLFWTGTNVHPNGSTLSNDDSVMQRAMDPGSGGIWYRKPVGVRNIVRKYDEMGNPYNDTIETYSERTFYGLATGKRDPNGWYTRNEFDKNGRVTTVWMPGDFARKDALDTVSYSGTQRVDLMGVTWYNRRIDQLHCDKDGAGHVISDTIIGPVTNTFMADTFYAALPVTTIPKCPCKDDSAITKEKVVRTIQQTCDALFPYNQHGGYKGFYGELKYTIDEECPFTNATRIDSAFLDIAISSIYGECVHLTVDVDTLLSKTFLFNCGGGGGFPSMIREKDGKDGRSPLGDQLMPIPGGYMLRVDLSSIAAQLHAKPLGSVLKTQLRTTTAGASITFVNGSSSEDLRPRYTVYGTYQRISDRADYTAAYDNDDAALITTATMKIDDRRHTANIYNDSILHGATVRRSTSKHYFGADNRLLRTETQVNEDAPRTVRVDTIFHTYTGLGQQRSTRDAIGDTTRTNYDGMGRAIETINHDGTRATELHAYGSAASFGISDQDFFGFCHAVTTTNEDGVKFTSYSDAFDRLRREVADSGGLRYTTRYEYDLAGRLTRVVNPKGDTTRYWSDEFGRTQYKRQPDIGIISYAYDKVGRVRFSQDNMQGDQQRLTFNQYDDLGRLTLTGEAFFPSPDSNRPCNDYNEDENFGDWRCTGDWDTRTQQDGNPPEKAKRRGRTVLGVLGDDPAPSRLTNQINPDSLHTWPVSSIPTANPTIWLSPVRPVPTFPNMLKIIPNCGQVQQNALLGETTPPLAPFIVRPTAFYTGTEPGASFNDFENVSRYPEFVRLAVAYDSIPASAGSVWANFPQQWQWDGLAPRRVVRNQRGREAAVAYRERGAEPYHYAVMSYDERGRVEALLRYTENLGFDGVYYTYNAMNQVTSVTVADYVRQYTTWYGYDGAGRIDSVWSSLSGAGGGLWVNFQLRPPFPQMRPDVADIVYRYNKVGGLDSMSYPPVNVLVTYAYNHRKWIDSIVATRNGGNLFREVLTYDPVGQIKQQVWQHGANAREKQTYTYDSVQRLTAWTKGPDMASTMPTDTSFYTYDAVGNRLTARQSWNPNTETYLVSPFGPEGNQLVSRRRFDGIAGDTIHSYYYNPNGAINGHYVFYEDSKAASFVHSEDFGYGYRGLLRRVRVIDYPSGVGGPWLVKDWRYRYSAGGEREQKRLYDANQNDSNMFYPWVYYLVGGTKEQLAVYHGQQTKRPMCGDTGRHVYIYPVEYLSYGLGKTANVLTLPNAGNPNGNKQYVVADHLGSVRSTVNLPGTVGTRDYMPFGETQAVTGTSTRKTFIDRENDRETDKGNFGVRVYDAAVGRFFSVDALWEKHRALTPYQYAMNNPMRLSDPSGLDSMERAKAIAKAKEYVSKKGDTHYQMGGKGGPGTSVDCSGLVSACLAAAGVPNPVGQGYNYYQQKKNPLGTGVEQHEAMSVNVVALRNVDPGNSVTFRTGGDWPWHIGIITEVYKGSDGAVTGFKMVHSSGHNDGVGENILGYGGPREMNKYEKFLFSHVFGYWRWDSPNYSDTKSTMAGIPLKKP